MRLLCFFGSGISKPSGMPMTDQITDAIFSGKWYQHTNQLFYPLLDPQVQPPGVTTATLAKAFMQVLRQHAEDYLGSRGGGKVNYEDTNRPSAAP